MGKIGFKRLEASAFPAPLRLDLAGNTGIVRSKFESVPSPKAEPIKLWLAKVGYERMQEMSDPGLALERARATWQKHGRSEKWIQQRMPSSAPERARPRAQQRKNHCQRRLVSFTNQLRFHAFSAVSAKSRRDDR